MDRFKACRIIANVMTNRGFMNGWFGDVSDEFKLEQANALFRLSKGEAVRWIDQNYFNMTRYCRIPVRVFHAMSHAEHEAKTEPAPIRHRLMQTAINCHPEEC